MSNLSTFVKFMVSLFCTATFLLAVWNLSVTIGKDCMRVQVRKLMMKKQGVAVKMGYYLKKLLPKLVLRVIIWVAVMYGASLYYNWTVHTLSTTENITTLALTGLSLIIISIACTRVVLRATSLEMRAYNRVYDMANEKIEGGLKGWLI